MDKIERITQPGIDPEKGLTPQSATAKARRAKHHCSKQQGQNGRHQPRIHPRDCAHEVVRAKPHHQHQRACGQSGQRPALRQGQATVAPNRHCDADHKPFKRHVKRTAHVLEKAAIIDPAPDRLERQTPAQRREQEQRHAAGDESRHAALAAHKHHHDWRDDIELLFHPQRPQHHIDVRSGVILQKQQMRQQALRRSLGRAGENPHRAHDQHRVIGRHDAQYAILKIPLGKHAPGDRGTADQPSRDQIARQHEEEIDPHPAILEKVRHKPFGQGIARRARTMAHQDQKNRHRAKQIEPRIMAHLLCERRHAGPRTVHTTSEHVTSHQRPPRIIRTDGPSQTARINPPPRDRAAR